MKKRKPKKKDCGYPLDETAGIPLFIGITEAVKKLPRRRKTTYEQNREACRNAYWYANGFDPPAPENE
jgi:hypothetical protein